MGTDDGGNRVDLFARFRAVPTPEQAARLHDAGAKTPYQAAVIKDANPGRRLRIYYGSGLVESLSYLYLTTVVSPRPERLDLGFTTGGYYLTGRNLRGLLDALEEERVRVLEPFDPERHLPPPDGAPVIETIEYETAEQAAAALNGGG